MTRTGPRSAARVAAVTAVLALAACSGGDGRGDVRLDATAPVAAGATAPAGATTTPGGSGSGGALAPKAILAATKRSVAFVSNDVGTGSGVLLPSGYVVTNAHVVQPFGEASLSFADGPTLDRVPVVGVDAWTDIAVLGPVKVDAPTLAVESAAGLEQGDRVYLVGYPDETERKPTPTITQGLVSRIRTVEAYRATYLQTDATIAGGQSGGALVDERGRVVGISGYSLDGFGIALRADEVAASVRRILDGKGDRYRSLPAGAGTATTGTLALDATTPMGELFLPPAGDDRKLTLKLSDPKAAFQVFDLFEGTSFGTNGIAEDAYLAALPPDKRAEERKALELVTPGADGSYTVEVPADAYALVILGPYADGAAHAVTWTTSAPVHPVVGLDTLAPLPLGTTVEGVVNSFDSGRGYTVALRKGQTLDLTLTAPMGQLAISVDGPGVDPLGDTKGSFTETDESPFEGSTADASFTAPADGTFRVSVECEDDVLVAYRLTATVR